MLDRATSRTAKPEEGETRPVAICAVQGMPGVGKSYLSERFAYLYRGRFPGGVYRLVLDPEGGGVPSAESLLGERTTPASELTLTPLERVGSAGAQRFEVTPPWLKAVYTDPESGAS